MSMQSRCPERGFSPEEYRLRLEQARIRMHENGLDGLVVTAPANFRYFSGFATQFWESPTRPWFLVLPREADPVAVVPEIGAPGLAQTWLEDIRTWPAPVPDDDGVSLLTQTLVELPRKFGCVGWEMGRESVIRMPIADFDRLRKMTRGVDFVDGSPTLWSLRMVKSDAEISRIRWVCQRASDAYAALPADLAGGNTDYEIARKLRLDVIKRGADDVPFMAVCGGHNGYEQIIVGPNGRTFCHGDVLFIDMGATFDGYFCDFDRNYSFGQASEQTRRAHEDLWRATEAGIAAARPGNTAADLGRAILVVLENAGYGVSNVGRQGHGLGMQLTEPPSNMPGDETPLLAGMVMTIEPGVSFGPGQMLVHEENVLITPNGCELLTRRAPREIPIINR